MMRGHRESLVPGGIDRAALLATTDRQSYNGGWKACWLLFTWLSLASVDPIGSLISQAAAADRPLSIGEHFELGNHERGARRHPYRIAKRPGAQISDTGTAEIDNHHRIGVVRC